MALNLSVIATRFVDLAAGLDSPGDNLTTSPHASLGDNLPKVPYELKLSKV